VIDLRLDGPDCTDARGRLAALLAVANAIHVESHRLLRRSVQLVADVERYRVRRGQGRKRILPVQMEAR
jgi:hypothetical protein